MTKDSHDSHWSSSNNFDNAFNSYVTNTYYENYVIGNRNNVQNRVGGDAINLQAGGNIQLQVGDNVNVNQGADQGPRPGPREAPAQESRALNKIEIGAAKIPNSVDGFT